MGIVNDNIKLLKGSKGTIMALENSFYREKPREIKTDSVGAHIRHMLEHYILFLDGLKGFKIDYDNRQRDLRISEDKDFAVKIIDDITQGLSHISPDILDKVIEIKSDCGSSLLWTKSSVERELQFLVSHSLHHEAMIRMILESEGIDVSEKFGIAPSTLKYNQK